MNLEELISKYLDSELSEAEDKELRHLTATDSNARMRFDALVSLHMAYKEDAESIEPPANLVTKTEQTVKLQMLLKKDAAMIVPPSGLVSSTEDKILAMMAEDEDNKVIPFPFLIPNKKLYGMAAAIALFFFFTVFDIQDRMFETQTTGNINPVETALIQSDIIPESTDKLATLAPTDEAAGEIALASDRSAAGTVAGAGNLSRPTSSVGIVEPANMKTSVSLAMSSDNDIKSNYNIRIINARAVFVAENTPSFASVEKKSKRMLSEPSISEAGNTEPSLSEANVSEEEDIASATDEHMIEPNSIFPASSMYSGTADASDVNSLHSSASLARTVPTETYNHKRISANDIVPGYAEQKYYKGGEEIRVTSFFGTDLLRNGIAAADDIVVSHISQSVAYPVNDYSTIGAEIGYSSYDYIEDSNNMKVSGFHAKTTSGIEASGALPSGYSGSREFLMNKTKQIFWGSIFYEITIYNSQDFSLSGRIGAGSSSEGPLGFGKVFAGYRLFSGFHLTLGAEGRMFVAKLPSLTGTGDDLKSSATLVYGFQIDL